MFIRRTFRVINQMLQEINPAVKVDQLEGHHGRSKRVSDQEQTSRTKRRGRGRRRQVIVYSGIRDDFHDVLVTLNKLKSVSCEVRTVQSLYSVHSSRWMTFD